MWRFLTILQGVFTFLRDLEDNRQRLTALNDKVLALASDVRSLSEKIEANAQQQASERKALILWFENELLKAEKETKLLKSAGKRKRKKL